MQYLIIGGGPAGLSAAATLRRIDAQSRVTILTKEKFPPYSKIGLPYLISGALKEHQLYLPVPEGMVLALEEEASEVHPGKREVRTVQGKKYSYDRLLIAPGSAPLRPGIEGSRLPFVFTIRDIPDMQGIRKLLNVRRTGRAVVAGAGPVGLELSDALHKLGFAITLVVSSERVFSTMLDAPASALLGKKLAANGVEVFTNTDIEHISGDGEARLSNGETRLCDLVVFGKGVAPTVHFLKGSGIGIRQGISVDRHQESNVPGIFAAGDAAETWDLVFEEARVNALWPVAFEQGKVAAYNMASRPLAYEGSFPRNILRVFGTSILAAGMAKAEGPGARAESGPDCYRKIVLDQGILKGFLFIGETRNEGLYADLLRRRVRVDSYAGSILRGSYDYSRHMKRSWKS